MDILPVLISGAGPTGLVMAIELARRQISCKIIDKFSVRSPLSRALGIHARSLEMFADIGVIDPILKQGIKARAIVFNTNKQPFATLDYARVESPYNFAIILPQSDTEKILEKKLNQLGVEVTREHRLESFIQNEKQVEVTISHNKQKITEKYAYLIACDGAHSTIRHQLNLKFAGGDYSEKWSLMDCDYAGFLEPHSLQMHFLPQGILAFFPLTQNTIRLVINFRLLLNDNSQPTLEEFQQIVEQAMQPSIKLSNPIWTTFFELHHRRIDNYQHGRVFLAGDAAHIHSPAGGQGMNTGMQDAYNLAWKLALVIKKQAQEKLLHSYTEERSPIAQQVLEASHRLTKMTLLKSDFSRNLRNTALKTFLKIPQVNKYIITDLAQLKVNYRHKQYIQENWQSKFLPRLDLSKDLKAGDRIVDANLYLPQNKIQSLYELVNGILFTLLYFVGMKPQATAMEEWKHLQKILQDSYKHLCQSFFIANPAYDLPAITAKQIIIDRNLSLHRCYHADTTALYFIRPDKYIGYRAKPVDTKQFLSYLKGCYSDSYS